MARLFSWTLHDALQVISPIGRLPSHHNFYKWSSQRYHWKHRMVVRWDWEWGAIWNVCIALKSTMVITSAGCLE